MIRDTFETNPGLCELFKRKILERARSVRLSEDLIDFSAHIDMKGTYQDNLRIFYRGYPQLSQNSDYLRISSNKRISRDALERSWRGYEQNERLEIPESARALVKSDWLKWPLTVTEFNPEPVEKLGRQEQEGWRHEDGERILSFRVTTFQSIIDRVTATTGEKVATIILHQIGKEVGRTAYSHCTDKMLSDNLVETLDRVLSSQGWGRVLNLDKTDHESSVTYVCSIKGCPLCYKRVSTSPTCDITRGIISGWLESFVQKNTESSTETACVATGSELCVFQVTFEK
jgi:predicted hydrocarbon binding protein